MKFECDGEYFSKRLNNFKFYDNNFIFKSKFTKLFYWIIVIYYLNKTLMRYILKIYFKKIMKKMNEFFFIAILFQEV